MAIREATLDDLEQIKILNTQTFKDNIVFDPDAIEDWAQTPQGDNYLRNAISDEKRCFLVYEEDNKVLGYADGYDMECDWRKSKYFVLVNLGIHPDKQGQGIGKSLMEHFTKWAKDRGFERIYLNCYIKNIGALDFYKKLGYKEIDVCLEKEI